MTRNEVVRLIKTGMSSADIARKLGISRERVRQILKSERICHACSRKLPLKK